jgi:hypothetical protein
VAVNTLLRERFAQAFAADDALAAAVDQMKAADFAGDKEALKRISEEARAGLEERAASGRYEYAGMDVAKSVRAFEKGYLPIKTNLANVQAYQQRVQDAYDKGDIDAETKSLMMDYSTHDYNGLSYDADGVLEETSYFKGKDFVKDVNISELFDERMKGIIMEKNVNATGEYITKENPVTGDVEYYVETKYGYEKMSAERIKGIFDDLMQDPDVQAAMAQKANLRTYSISDEDLESRLMTALMGDPEDDESTGLQGALAEAEENLDKAVGKTKTAIAKQKVETIQSMIDQYQEILSNEGKTPEEAAAQRRAFAKELAVQSEYQRELGAAYEKFEIFNITDNEQSVKYSELHVAKVNNAYKNRVRNLQVPLQDMQVDNPGGFSLDNVEKYVETEQDLIDDAVKDLNERDFVRELFGGNVGNYTEEDILSGNVHESLKQPMEQFGDRSVIADVQDAIKSHRREIDLQNQLLKQAEEKTGYVSYIDKIVTQKVDGIKGSDILEYAKEFYDMPEMTPSEFTRLMREEAEKYGGYSMAESGEVPYLEYPDGSSISNFAKLVLRQSGKDKGTSAVNKDQFLQDLNNQINRNRNSGADVLNSYLEENAKRIVSGFGSTLFPGETEDGDQSATLAFKDFFVGKPVPENFNYGFGGRTYSEPGNEDYQTGTLDEFRRSGPFFYAHKNKAERDAWRNGEIKVQDVLFNSSPGPGSGAVTLVVVNERGDTDQLHITEDQFRNKGVSKYINTPQWRAEVAANRAENIGLDSYTFELGNGLGSMKFEFTEGADYVQFTKPITNPKTGEQVIDTRVVKTDSYEYARTLDVLNMLGALPF